MTDKIIRIILDSRKAEENAKSLDSAVKGAGASADGTAFSMNKLAVAISAAISVDKILKYSDAWVSVQNSLRQVTTSQQQLSTVTADVLKIAIDTRTNLEATASLYATLSRSTQDLGLSQEKLGGIVKTINNTFLAAGASAEATKGSLVQLSQAFASGVLRGDEFNSVAEQAPGIMKAISLETGKTIGQLRDFAATGGITSDILIKSLENYAVVAQEAADKSQRTFGQSAELAKTNAIAFVGNNKDIQSATSAAGNAVVFLSKNINVLVTAMEAAAIVMSTRLAVSIGTTMVTAFASATAATATLSTAMATLGGPVGIALLAAFAIYEFSQNTETATQKITRLTQETDAQVKSFKQLDDISKEQKLKELKDDIDKSSEALKRNTEEIERAKASMAGNGYAATALSQNVRELKKDNLALNETLQQQIANLEKLRGVQIDISQSDFMKKMLDAAEKGADFQTQQLNIYDKERDRLNEQVALLGKKGDAAKVAYETQYGALQDLLPESKKELIDLAKKIDLYNELKTKKEEEKKQAGFKETQVKTENKEAENTAVLRDELALRQTISQQALDAKYNYLLSDYDRQLKAITDNESIKKSELQKSIDAENRQRQEQRATEIHFANEHNLSKAQLEKDYADQDSLLRDIRAQEQIKIEADKNAAIEALDREVFKTRLANVGELGSAMMSLGQGHSKKIFEVGKTLALAQAAVALPTAVMESFKNGGGYPWGLVPAGAMLATGLSNINKIKSTTFGGGGGNATIGGGSSGGGIGSTNIPSTSNSEVIPKQKQIIELKGLKPTDLITGQMMADIMSQDDSIVVAFNAANTDASRRGVF